MGSESQREKNLGMNISFSKSLSPWSTDLSMEHKLQEFFGASLILNSCSTVVIAVKWGQIKNGTVDYWNLILDLNLKFCMHHSK